MTSDETIETHHIHQLQGQPLKEDRKDSSLILFCPLLVAFWWLRLFGNLWEINQLQMELFWLLGTNFTTLSFEQKICTFSIQSHLKGPPSHQNMRKLSLFFKQKTLSKIFEFVSPFDFRATPQ